MDPQCSVVAWHPRRQVVSLRPRLEVLQVYQTDLPPWRELLEQALRVQARQKDRLPWLELEQEWWVQVRQRDRLPWQEQRQERQQGHPGPERLLVRQVFLRRQSSRSARRRRPPGHPDEYAHLQQGCL